MVSQKGGSGKTTLACALAVAGEAAGLASVLIDLDPQASATRWADLRTADTPVVTSAHAPRLTPVLDAARAAGAGLAIIDTAPHAADAALQAARAADLILIPCRPSAPDLTAIGASVDLAHIADTTVYGVLNAAPVRNALVDQARDVITGYKIETAPAVLHQRIDHVHAWTAGLTASELNPKGKAAREVDALFAWIQEQGGLSG